MHEYARLVADADERFRLCVRLMLYDVAIEVRENFRCANRFEDSRLKRVWSLFLQRPYYIIFFIQIPIFVLCFFLSQTCISLRDRDRLLLLDEKIVTKHGANARAHLLLLHRMNEESSKGIKWQ